MALNVSQSVSLGDIWDNDDILLTPNPIPIKESYLFEDSGKDKDPFVTSQNMFYSAEEQSPTLMNQSFEESAMNFNISSEQWMTDFGLPSLDKSPSHESDSGMSTMSEVGSTHETNLPILQWPEGEDDLAAYLLGTDVSNLCDEFTVGDAQKESVLPKPRPTSPPKPVYNTRSKSTSTVSQKVLPVVQDDEDLNIEVECSDNESFKNGSASPDRLDAITSSSTYQALNYFEDVCNSNKKKPSVKIVKVLKTSADSECCDDDIVKALDERSRKNAIQAKMNREKKKKYVNNLEMDVERLGKENKELKEENAGLKENVTDLEEEVRYLKSVLVNASALSGMLKNINGVSDVKLSASIVSRKRSSSACNDHSYTATGSNVKRARMVQANLEKAGVCLHVNGGEASLEFCAKCSALAQRSAIFCLIITMFNLSMPEYNIYVLESHSLKFCFLSSLWRMMEDEAVENGVFGVG
ncbi:Creb/atf bzip transcription factor [Plakobranchus ocellatus]|uniref:X-box-binding protein 1 n=1 Tax=Plakobranchus ocellatus TaxID=259542 RepID=A0AAV4BMZ8_9GAST|nr:Creb/atf bzip transcription factor [Plakobranchus ocellatus]